MNFIDIIISFFFFFVCLVEQFFYLGTKQKTSLIMVVSQLIPSFNFLFSQFASQLKISVVLKHVSTEQISRIKCTYTFQKTVSKSVRLHKAGTSDSILTEENGQK